MGLDVVDIGRCQLRRRQCFGEQRLLRWPVGNGHSAAGTVLVDRRTAHHRKNAVAVAHRVIQPLEHHHRGTLAAHVPIGGRIEGLAPPLR